jgi:hypothetical protein
MVMVMGSCSSVFAEPFQLVLFFPLLVDRFVLYLSTCSVLVASPMTDRRLHGPWETNTLEWGI